MASGITEITANRVRLLKKDSVEKKARILITVAAT